jgi:hypothetical protein
MSLVSVQKTELNHLATELLLGCIQGCMVAGHFGFQNVVELQVELHTTSFNQQPEIDFIFKLHMIVLQIP